MRKPLIVGNWKMHGDLRFAEQLAGNLVKAEFESDAEVVLLPSFIQIPAVAAVLFNECSHDKSQKVQQEIQIGAQNLSAWKSGAFTGEVSGEMLKGAGCRWVLVGHSERRALFGERNDDFVEKILRADEAGLLPIYCVGETLTDRKQARTEAVLCEQIEAVFSRLDESTVGNIVVAYEPVWAIGTGETASPDQAQSAHECIRAKVAEIFPRLAGKLRILYGGSVKPENAADLMSMPDIDGALVGGASLDAQSFVQIVNSVVE